MTSRPRFASRRTLLALGISLAFHVLLLVASVLVRQQVRAVPRETIDSRLILADGPRLSFEMSSGVRRGQSRVEEGSEEQSAVPVRVDQGPATAYIPGQMGPTVLPRQVPGGGGGAGGAGPGPGATFFKVPVSARVVFVLDRSLSMGLDGCLTRARMELLRCLRSLPAGSFQVVLYNTSADALAEGSRLLPVDEATLRLAEQALTQTVAEGATDHENALRLALSFDADVIFLVTDADDLAPAVLRRVRQLNRRPALIHTVDVSHRLRAQGMLHELARENGGVSVRLAEQR